MPSTSSQRPRGFTLADLAAILAGLVLLAVIAIPTLGAARITSGVQQSMSNVAMLGLAHAMYGVDSYDRQLTFVVDDIASYGDSGAEAFPNYRQQHYYPHPNMLAGWGTDSQGQGVYLYRYVLDGTYPGHHFWAGNPIVFSGALEGFGWHRLTNLKPLHDYVGSRWYDPTYYAPNDTVPYDWAEPLFESPWEVVPAGLTGGTHIWTSYSLSPAALFDPEVMRHPDDGGWQNPWLLDYGLATPAFSQALYPSLKTQFIEHHWLQNAPADQCNPLFEFGTYDNCEPYYFNHAMASEPVTLFYDMSVRLFPNSEAKAADDYMIGETGYGLWSRDTPFGTDGYYNELAHDPVGLSHHMLTTDGIRGRDTLASVPLEGLSRPASRRGFGSASTTTSLRRPTPRPFDPANPGSRLQPE